jgi:DHA3 family multidrug efflux protein-like MFS transporter
MTTTPAQGQRTFLQLLVNTLLVSVLNFTVWFAITFYVYLQTRSVFATGMVAGVFLVATAGTGIWFGSLVDHHRKKTVMQVSAACSLACYLVSFGVYQLTPHARFTDVSSVALWGFILLLMAGVIAGNIRSIALMTLVTALIAEDRRDRANGLVGTTSGISILVTSVISGLLVGAGGMFYVLLLALVVLVVALVHLGLVPVPEQHVAPSRVEGETEIDIRGTLRIISGVPGLAALIVFSCLNNFLGGVFMALLDAYGLSFLSVQAWGLLWGVLSTGFIVGGLLVAKGGLGGQPVRVLLLVNLALWTVGVIFPLRTSVVLMSVGLYLYMVLVPFAEAAEQTILQRLVPYERQGRVFGFAQSVEQAASPLTAFLIGPLTQFVVIPSMTDGLWARLIGGWFGTGQDRGIALVFVLTGILGLVFTGLALSSRYYRQLRDQYSGRSTDASVGQNSLPPQPAA